MKIYLARYRGFCSGVKRSIRMAEKALAERPGPVNILNEIVHNKSVAENLQSKGLNRINELKEAKSGTLVISAHGIPRATIDEAKSRNLEVVDTTCPLVYKIHKAAKELIEKGYDVILFGDPGHDEVVGIQAIDPGHIHVLKSIDDIESLPELEGSIGFISQSTKNVERFHEAAEKLIERYGPMRIENTICRATRLRQETIKEIANKMELVMVIGSTTSANANRLVEIAREPGTTVYLIDSADKLDLNWLYDIERIGITASASTPDYLVSEVIEKIRAFAEDEGLSFELIER